MFLKYVYDSNSKPSYREKLIDFLDRLEKKGIRIDRINTADWDQDRRWNFYLNELIPLSVLTKKKLRGRVRTHKSGSVLLRDVVIVNNDFFVGEEGIRWLRQFMSRKEVKF